ncbi:hypothetical protein R1flu_008853 [Riccia fluitans]|uniref:TBCC domain-containing protein 1 n=1 Tax=Riccia fluitans TaxID=41844 RepID=A0ABD1Z0X6_9MARC
MSAETISAASLEPPWLHVRREPFEYGLLPLPSLITNEGVSALKNLRTKLSEHVLSTSAWPTSNAADVNDVSQGKFGKNRLASAGIAASLGLPEPHAHLVLDTLASVLPDDGGDFDPLARARVLDIESVGADIDDLILLLYIQTYKRVPPRPHKDPAAVADVWPTPSVFDGYLPATSPLQNRSSRRTMPCLAEEEAHQLAFVRKHLPSILALLAESTEDGDHEAKVITLEKFQHLSLLLRAADASTGCLPLSQATPFFANSDPDMPAAPVPLSQVLDWMLSHLCAASERNPAKAQIKDNGFHESDGSESDVPMADACVTATASSPSGGLSAVPNGFSQTRKDWQPDGVTFVEGIMRASVLKTEADVKNGSVKVAHCHDSVVYVLGPLKYVSVFGCSDSIVVLGAVGKAVRVELCERVQLIVASARICISNCRECLFNLGVNQRPLVTGDNHNLQVAPYNTSYPKLEADLAQVGIDPTVNKWDSILTLGVVDPHDSVPHPAGVADAQAEGASFLPPERFINYVIPRWSESEPQEQQVTTGANPFLLPKAYSQAQQHRSTAAESLKQTLKSVVLEEQRKRDLTIAIHAHFKDWLLSTGNIRQIYDLQSLERDPKAMD